MTKENNQNKKKKKNPKFYKILSFILIIISVIASGVLIYFNVLPLKYLIPGLAVLLVFVFFLVYKLNKRTCLFTKLVVSLFSIILILIELLGITYAMGTLSFLNDIFDTGYHTDQYSIYVLSNSSYEKVSDLKNKKITIYSTDEDNLSSAVSKLENKITFTKDENDSLSDSVDAVLNGDSDALFISENLMQIYKEDHEDEYAQLKLLDTINVLTQDDTDFESVNVKKNSFIVYLSGTDTYGSINTVSRSDVNIILVVNPQSGKILILNTPRDYYVTLGTKNKKDKLTHAGIYGIEESAKTLNLLYDMEINYYARVNFTSFVKIIDALGGIQVESQYNFSYDGYTFKKGTNTLKGAAALAFSRGRKMLPLGDVSRGYNQQAVIKGLIAKLSDPTILAKYTTLLSSLKSGVLTNIDQSTITKLVNYQLDKDIDWDIDTYSVTGTDDYQTTYSTGSYKCYVMQPDEDSVTEAKAKIQEVLNEE